MIISSKNTAKATTSDATETTEQTVVVQPTKSPEYKGSNVNLAKTSVSQLLVYIEGASMTVDYYSQVLGKDDELSEQQVGQSAIYQQYHKINGLEFKVQDGFTTSEINETRDVHIRGTSILYPFVVPNVGDMFVADVELGKLGVFTITATERKRVFKETCYEVEYKLVDYLTQERTDDFRGKVVKESHFKKDMLAYGQNPVLTSQEINAFELMGQEEHKLSEVYIKDFYNHDFKTLVVPDQDTNTIYDHRVVQLLFRLIDSHKHPFMSKVVEMGVEAHGGLTNECIWDLVLKAEAHLLPLLSSKYWAIPSASFNPYPMLNGIYHSGIRRVMWPIDEETGYKSALSYLNNSVGIELIESTTRLTTFDPDIPKMREDLGLDVLTPAQIENLIHLVTVDDSYVLSENFYTQNLDGMSQLEHYVFDLINGKAIEPREIVFFAQLSMYWGSVERFYYQPLLIVLLRYCKSKY